MGKARVVEPKIIVVKNHVYVTIRSFVESSTKDKYEWNTCVKTPREWSNPGIEVIECEKRGKWRLAIVKSDNVYGASSNLMMGKPPYRSVMLIENDNNERKIEIGEVEIDLKNLDLPPNAILLVPEDREKVPYPRPISLSEIISKLEHYGAL